MHIFISPDGNEKKQETLEHKKALENLGYVLKEPKKKKVKKDGDSA